MDAAVDRMYRTGDLGRSEDLYYLLERCFSLHVAGVIMRRYNVNGDVECSGRADDQIKIRGFRIELGEINAFLSKHPFVKENVTIMREDKPGNKELVSYVVATDSAPRLDVRQAIPNVLCAM
jgi:acyl-coenzyme A synthetase/AMP-(fatty) acid ligase